MPVDPKMEIYPSGRTTPMTIVRDAAIVSIGLLIVTIVVVRYCWGAEHLWLLYSVIGLWAVGPPVWFWFEYFYIYRAYGQPDTLDLFKCGQDVSKAIWAGVLAVLIAFAATGAGKSTTKCTLDCPAAAASDSSRPGAR